MRRGVNITYAVGWVRQEENQYLACPQDIARTLDDDLLRIMRDRLPDLDDPAVLAQSAADAARRHDTGEQPAIGAARPQQRHQRQQANA